MVAAELGAAQEELTAAKAATASAEAERHGDRLPRADPVVLWWVLQEEMRALRQGKEEAEAAIEEAQAKHAQLEATADEKCEQLQKLFEHTEVTFFHRGVRRQVPSLSWAVLSLIDLA